METWIIERYNKGQDKYKITTIKEIWDTYRLTIEEKACNTTLKGIYLYNFLFNPKWLFAEAFSKTIYDNHQCYILDGGHNLEDEHTYEAIQFELKDMLLEQMVISPDPLKYLAQFKDRS